MRAIVIKRPGGPEVLEIEERPDPVPGDGQILIEVKGFGLNAVEASLRKGAVGDVPEISGVEAVGIVRLDPSGTLQPGQAVIVGYCGMGRAINGSYAELLVAPATHVIPVNTTLPWSTLAALPVSYVTAWVALHGVLEIKAGQTLLLRGATTALGRACINVAKQAGVDIIATSRSAAKLDALKAAGATEALVDAPDLSKSIRQTHPGGIDAALDIVGNTTILDTLATLRRGGRACLVGLLDAAPPMTVQPLFQVPSGVHLSVLATAAVMGTPSFPLAEVPFQQIIDDIAAGKYDAAPARIFAMDDIQDAHRLMESGAAGGKIVVTL